MAASPSGEGWRKFTYILAEIQPPSKSVGPNSGTDLDMSVIFKCHSYIPLSLPHSLFVLFSFSSFSIAL